MFSLHHTQLDRLWWKWQQIEPQKQLTEYLGEAAYVDDSKDATLDDLIILGGLAPDVRVRDIIDTESVLLCYRY